MILFAKVVWCQKEYTPLQQGKNVLHLPGPVNFLFLRTV